MSRRTLLREAAVAEKAFTRNVHRSLPRLMAADLVLVTLPDGEELVAKRIGTLHGISAQGVARNLVIMRLNAPTIEAAAALDTVLGNDGFYTNPGRAGHA